MKTGSRAWPLMIIVMVLLSACGRGAGHAMASNSQSESTQIETQNQTADLARAETVLSEEHLRYLGAFRLPEDGASEESMFSWGGEALAYNPNHHSLFIAGHNWHTNIAEISIPEPIVAEGAEQLNQSRMIQAFRDIKGQNFSDWTFEIPRVGLEVIKDKLYYCFGEHLEENTDRGTHGYCDLQLNPHDSVCIVGDCLYATNDYLFAVPENWQPCFDGCDLLTGRFRDGGWGGMGPSLFAIRSTDIESAGNDERISAVAVLRYDDSYEGDTGSKMYEYSHADSITGGAFVDCDLGSSIVFVATHGFDDTWYGFSNGVVYPTDGSPDAVYPSVPPYPHDQRGWWNDDFRAALILYRPADVSAVYRSELSADTPQPYVIIDLTEYMLAERDATCMVYLGSCAYDPVQNRLYVLELFADGDKPVVHVFTFE